MDRGCTDILCCLIFVAFIVGMVYSAGFGIMYGDPYLLLTTWDYDGNGCGYTARTKDYPLLYFPTIDIKAAQNADASVDSVTEILKYSTCVKKCPTKTSAVECYEPKFMKDSP